MMKDQWIKRVVFAKKVRDFSSSPPKGEGLNERGMVLIMALLILTMLTILSMAAVMFTSTDNQITRNYKIYQQTFYDNEGVVELVPGVLRRTIALQTENTTMLLSMGIVDADHNGIADDDEGASIFISDLSVDSNGNGEADFVDTIMGYSTSSFTFTVRNNLYDTDLQIDREGPFSIPGFSSGFATGYGGGSITGRAINYESTATREGRNDARSQIVTGYQCTERGGGGCL